MGGFKVKKYLMKRQKALEDKRAKLLKRSEESEDINEVRAIGEELLDIASELREISDQLAKMADTDDEPTDDNRACGDDDEKRSAPPASAVRVNGDIAGKILGTFEPSDSRKNENVLESLEYRRAFMNYIQRNTPIPSELTSKIERRAGEAINSDGTEAAIPITVMREIINTVRKRYGNLYSKVRKLNVQGGVEFPIGALSATFKWINEKTVSPTQDIGKLSKVTFNYHTAEIRIAQTFLSSILTIDAFEAKVAEVIAIAYMEAMDFGIVRGSGNGSMLGILNDARVTKNVSFTGAQLNNWQEWKKKFFKMLPPGYRAGEFIFAYSTVDTYLETMSDANNNPIFRQATGLEVGDMDALYPSGRFFGRDISLVETNILPDFDAASSSDVIGIYWQPQEYAINENYGFAMRRYFDDTTNEWINKALTVVDGKVLNPEGFVLIKKA